MSMAHTSFDAGPSGALDGAAPGIGVPASSSAAPSAAARGEELMAAFVVETARSWPRSVSSSAVA
jgi:hypothetical protein